MIEFLLLPLAIPFLSKSLPKVLIDDDMDLIDEDSRLSELRFKLDNNSSIQNNKVHNCFISILNIILSQ